MEYELIIIWSTGEKDIEVYSSIEKAEEAGGGGRKWGVNMADIELVIKIDKELYESCKRECKETDDLIIDTFTLLIGYGKPLPKGHGRLIDEDEIAGDGSWDFADRLGATPTIIEADKAESEE